LFVFCFFFQAEDGIRDRNVTGVQTCALPISIRRVDKRATIHTHLLLRSVARYARSFAGKMWIKSAASPHSLSLGGSLARSFGLRPHSRYDHWRSRTHAPHSTASAEALGVSRERSEREARRGAKRNDGARSLRSLARLALHPPGTAPQPPAPPPAAPFGRGRTASLTPRGVRRSARQSVSGFPSSGGVRGRRASSLGRVRLSAR